MKKEFWEEIINFSQNTQSNNFLDIHLKNIAKLNQYDSFEIYFMIYPYANNITSENLKILPFEEYVKDVIGEKSSVYTKIPNSSNNFFGMFLGIIILIIFWTINPKMLYSVEAIASIFGFYVIGKELWYDINKFLIKATRAWKIVYKENEYTYELKSRNELTNYTFFAKKQRHGKAVVLPKKMSYIEQSNSITIRMSFDTKDFIQNKEDLVYLFSIKIDENLTKDLLKSGFMLGCKINFNKNKGPLVYKYDISQSINLNKIGCLDNKGNWHEGSVFIRNNVSLANIKYYKSNKLSKSKTLIKK